MIEGRGPVRNSRGVAAMLKTETMGVVPKVKLFARFEQAGREDGAGGRTMQAVEKGCKVVSRSRERYSDCVSKTRCAGDGLRSGLNRTLLASLRDVRKKASVEIGRAHV